ncbi:hypothetical protein [Fenollaria massiliensis]|uniref:Copper amine oxidase-like N-terminal domain-containing protein n=1 Tax=Fenollaria massiliensis TaxID=938288 RepID=A0A9E7IX21_9FIRM|nr:hypothetical protein [Fenollaria massiliensis]UQK58931.1 hypothetical protein M1R53_06735 [Fenollaria massiliensis]
MKKKISLLLAILMLVTLIPTAFAESKTVDAVKNTKKVTLDGEEVKVGAYDVEGYNYLKLRDVAAILNAKKCQFNIGYDEPRKLITVELAKAYEKQEGDLAEIKEEKAKAIVSVKKILVNGEEKEIKTALINEYNYMQLRDLGSLVGLDVKYDAKNKVIMLNSDAQAKEEAPRYVMIKSKLYKDTGEINKNMKCGTMDGKISTSVDAKEMPKKDNESNFGTGYEYQIGTDGSITVDIDDKCLIFKEVKEEEKKDEKNEDKKDEKTDEKKEEKKEEVKTEDNVKVIKTDNFDALETAKLDAMEKLHNMFSKYTKDSYIVKDNLFTQVIPGADTMISLKNFARLLGSDLYIEEHTSKKRIEEVDGIPYYAVEFIYPNGSSLIERLSVEPVDGDIKFLKNVLILPMITVDGDKSSILDKDQDYIIENIKKFHDALAAKNFKNASDALKALNFKATEENVKKMFALRCENAEKLGVEIFSTDYTFKNEKDEDDYAYTFTYKNGAKFMIYLNKQYPGLASLVVDK